MKAHLISSLLILTSITAQAEVWSCRNHDLEIQCGEGKCESVSANGDSGFTPMDITVADSGAVSVCAYTGCWEGEGKVLRTDDFLVVAGHELPFSTAAESRDMRSNVLVAVDLHDGFGVIKAGGFAHPVRCRKSE